MMDIYWRIRDALGLSGTNDPQPLGPLADLCGSDKGSRGDGHGYTRVYDRIFDGHRTDPITMLIGLMRPEAIGAARGTPRKAEPGQRPARLPLFGCGARTSKCSAIRLRHRRFYCRFD